MAETRDIVTDLCKLLNVEDNDIARDLLTGGVEHTLIRNGGDSEKLQRQVKSLTKRVQHRRASMSAGITAQIEKHR